MDLCWQSNASAFKYPVWVGHSFSSKEQASFFFLSKHLLMSWLQSPSAMILELPQIKSLTISIVRDWSDRVPEELWMEVCDIVQEAVIKTIPKKNKCKKAKWLSEEVLQIAVKGNQVKGKGEKERYPHFGGRKWQATPVFLPGESHEQRSLVGYCSWGHKESDATEWLSTFPFECRVPENRKER